MATKTLPVCFALNNSGAAADPDSADVMLVNPDGSEHTAWTSANPGKLDGSGSLADVGTGSLMHNFTIDDGTDVAGQYHAYCRAVYGANTVKVVIQVEVDL